MNPPWTPAKRHHLDACLDNHDDDDCVAIETEREVERAQKVVDRIRSHSKTVRMIVDDAILWVDTNGKQGKRFKEQ